MVRIALSFALLSVSSSSNSTLPLSFVCTGKVRPSFRSQPPSTTDVHPCSSWEEGESRVLVAQSLDPLPFPLSVLRWPLLLLSSCFTSLCYFSSSDTLSFSLSLRLSFVLPSLSICTPHSSHRRVSPVSRTLSLSLFQLLSPSLV